MLNKDDAKSTHIPHAGPEWPPPSPRPAPGLLDTYDAPLSLPTLAPCPLLVAAGEEDPRCPLPGMWSPLLLLGVGDMQGCAGMSLKNEEIHQSQTLGTSEVTSS